MALAGTGAHPRPVPLLRDNVPAATEVPTEAAPEDPMAMYMRML
jgi:hypothetical protein